MPEFREGLVALIADDHELFRLSLADLLMKQIGFSAVVSASSLDEAFQKLGEHPDISFAIFDLIMPGMEGAQALRGVKTVWPHLKVAVISGSASREDVFDVLQAGAAGFIPKTFGVKETSHALEAILAGAIFLPPESVLRSQASGPSGGRSATSLKALTARQTDVLRLIRQGLSNKEIARELNLAENTIKVHAHALFRILGVQDRREAAKL